MSTLDISLSGASFPADWPVAYPDSIMSAGSLLLLDPSAVGGYDGGSAIPVDGAVIPNIAWETAAAILGAGSRSSLSSAFAQVGLSGTSSSKHRVEWTSKGGLHTIVSQSPGLTSGDNTRITIADPISDYIFANTPGRNFYYSAWMRTTRAQLTSSAPQPFTAIGGSSSNYLLQNSSLGLATAGTDKESASPNTVAVHFSSAKFNAWTGTKPGTLPATSRWAWCVGSYGNFASFNLTSAASRAVYRIYLEDLDISGRTYAEVNAIDKALYTAAFAEGGRFYNDSFTAPSTIA